MDENHQILDVCGLWALGQHQIKNRHDSVPINTSCNTAHCAIHTCRLQTSISDGMEVHYGPINAERYSQLLEQHVLSSRCCLLLERAFNTDLHQLLQQYGWEMAWLQSTPLIRLLDTSKSPAAGLLSSNIQFVFYVQL